MYFIYVFYLKSPPPRFPPTVYLFQPGLTHVVHSKLPGFAPTPPVYKKNKNRSQLTVQLVPVNTPVHTKEKQK